MSKYKLSESEQDILKVAKYNQKIGNSLLEELDKLKDRATAANESNEQFLRLIEKKLGIQPDIVASEPTLAKCQSPIIPDWDQILGEASSIIAYDVGYEDLLTTEEFENAYRHLDEINEQFSNKTKLRKIDWIFLVTAIALQCTRQYVIDPWLQKTRPSTGTNDEKGRKNNAEQGWYYVETKKILTNRVPFDAQIYGTSGTIKGFLKGGDHRMTLGHDPLLG
jgi:hypothetical protein